MVIASIMAWPGAIAIGVSLGLLGSGGSILTVPVLVYLIGQDEKVAIAGSLFIVGSIALAGSLQFLRAGFIDWRSVAIFGIPGMAGTWFGALLSAYIPGITQLALFAVVMLLASWLMLRPIKLDTGDGRPRALWKIAGDGLVVGVITGLVGVGGGFLIVPALVLLGGLSMHRAVATSLVIIALSPTAVSTSTLTSCANRASNWTGRHWVSLRYSASAAAFSAAILPNAPRRLS
jgi:uncharacterized membrane protein YfcA